MANSTRLVATYAVSSKIEPFYKGGKVQISNDEQYIFCTCGSRVNILEISTGKIVHCVEHDDQEDITSFAVSSDDEMLVTASRALLLKQWDWRRASCTRSWRAIHTVPVASMTFDSSSTLLATGGCDGTIKLWDVVKQYCTHNLKGSSGVVHLVQFHPDISRLQLFSSSLDCGIRMWDLRSSQCVCVLQSHYSSVTSLSFSADGGTMVSSGRDKICTVWDLNTRQAKRTVPIYEAVEGVVLLPKDEDLSQLGVKSKDWHFITAGSKGILRVWHASTARCVYTQKAPSTLGSATGEAEEQDDNPFGLTHLFYLPASHRVATVTAEHNILLYQLPGLTTQQQFVGYSDEVLDVKFLGKNDSHIVVATNSSQLKVFELLTNSCQILFGHTDTVLTLDVFKKGLLFASCAKDRSVRVWQMDSDSGQVCCVAQGTSHTNAVGSISSLIPLLFVHRMKASFVATGSQDCTVKVWDLPPDLSSEDILLPHVSFLQDVNSVAVSPNDKLLASGSQDRTARLWSLAVDGNISLLGVFRGHRRGIWSVCFSPVDQVLATSSADGTTKLWSLQDFSCLKVGVTARSTLRLWVWPSRWISLTQRSRLSKVGFAAVCSAFFSRLPLAVLFLAFCQSAVSRSNAAICLTFGFSPSESLLRFCVVWNTNARNCLDAQAVLQVLLTHMPPEELLQYQGARTHLEGLIPYTERHMQRIGRLLQASMFLNYMWQKMRVAGGPTRWEISQTVFYVDKDKGSGSARDDQNQEEDSDSSADEDPNSHMDDEDEEEEVSSARKASTNTQEVEKKKRNGLQLPESEDSSEEGIPEDNATTSGTVEVMKKLRVFPSTLPQIVS
uniref:Transducin beta like 3 n=1 Tax=Oryzias sinensis TaxID=183150 RepID=A0A8C8DW70_9TELE